MSEAIRDVAIPSSALLSEDLMGRYGEDSHHDGVERQARFESRHPDGREFRVLLTQRGIGSAAVYKANVSDVFDSSYEIILTMQAGMLVTETLKSDGRAIAAVHELPGDTGSEILHGCYGNQRY